METKRKVIYEAPMAIVLELKYEGIICSSDDDSDIPGNSPYTPGGNPFSF